MKEFKQSLNACRGHCTIYTDRLHVESDVGYMALLAHAEIGSVFKESAIVDLELRGETWYVNGRRFDIDDLKEVLVTEFARFQLATLQVANALESRCKHHNLIISYGTAHNPDRQTVAINVFNGDTMQFKVCVIRTPRSVQVQGMQPYMILDILLEMHGLWMDYYSTWINSLKPLASFLE